MHWAQESSLLILTFNQTVPTKCWVTLVITKSREKQWQKGARAFKTTLQLMLKIEICNWSSVRTVHDLEHSENGFYWMKEKFHTCTNEIFVAARTFSYWQGYKLLSFEDFVFESRKFRSGKTNIVTISKKKFLWYGKVNFCVGIKLNTLNQGNAFLDVLARCNIPCALLFCVARTKDLEVRIANLTGH